MKRRTDMAFADGKPLAMHLQAAQRKYTAKAREWLARESARLGVAESEILDAIKRGYLPEFIAAIEPNSPTFARVFGDRVLPWRGKAA